LRGLKTEIALHVRSSPAGERVLKRTSFLGYFFVDTKK
jgi:hypothetical protein